MVYGISKLQIFANLIIQEIQGSFSEPIFSVISLSCIYLNFLLLCFDFYLQLIIHLKENLHLTFETEVNMQILWKAEHADLLFSRAAFGVFCII